jgi:hypothetical protein
MSPTRVCSAICVLAAAFPMLQAPQGVERVRWLTGCWETTQGPRVVKENWAAPVHGVMTETGTTSRGDTLLESETIRLFQRGPKLIYEARPSGQAAAEFASTTVTDSTVVFTNPARSFPKSIGYRIHGDSLFARVEGAGRGSLTVQVIDFPYHRVNCGGH